MDRMISTELMEEDTADRRQPPATEFIRIYRTGEGKKEPSGIYDAA